MKFCVKSSIIEGLSSHGTEKSRAESNKILLFGFLWFPFESLQVLYGRCHKKHHRVQLRVCVYDALFDLLSLPDHRILECSIPLGYPSFFHRNPQKL